MCICCCFCNCCNSYSSKCVEFCILTLSSATFICSILGFVFIKWSHLTIASSILLIILIALSTFMEISSICIIIFRYKGTIHQKTNSLSSYFALFSLIFSIIILLLSLVAESLVQTNFKDLDYPCKDISLKNDQNVILFRFLSLEFLSDEEKLQFCKSKNINYNAKICSNLEYTMSYLTASIIEFCSLILSFFWYNDYRRIKEKVDGELPIYGNTYLTRARLEKELNFRENGDSPEPSGRYLNQNNLVVSQVVIVNNKNKNSRKSQPINYEEYKKAGNKNFIRDLRKEMQEAIESLDEESNGNKEQENNNNNINIIKDNENKKKENDDLYSDKKSSNSSNSKKSDKKSESNNYSKNIVFIDNEDNKDDTNEDNLKQKDISIFKVSQNQEQDNKNDV